MSSMTIKPHEHGQQLATAAAVLVLQRPCRMPNKATAMLFKATGCNQDAANGTQACC
jgi:hypothetical protein